MQQIIINKKPRPVHFGTAAIMKLEQITGRGFYDFLFSLLPTEIDQTADEKEIGFEMIKNVNVTDGLQIIYAGIYGGAKKEKIELDIDFEGLIDEVDECENLFELISQALFIAINSLPKPKEEPGKKKAAIKSKGVKQK